MRKSRLRVAEVLHVLGDGVLKDVACRVNVDGTAPEASATEVHVHRLAPCGLISAEHADTKQRDVLKPAEGSMEAREFN